MDTRGLEYRVAVATRLAALLPVAASLVGALLMIFIGLKETALAFWTQFTGDTGAWPRSSW